MPKNNTNVINWQVVLSDQVQGWLDGLPKADLLRVMGAVEQLEIVGPELGAPLVKVIRGSAVHKMKELRVSTADMSIRVLFAFDRKRQAILLVGGDKREEGWEEFYTTNIPIADKLFQEHEAAIVAKEKKEGLAAAKEAKALAKQKSKNKKRRR